MSRYHTSRLTLAIDWLMDRLIRVGGWCVIGAVVLMLVFIASVGIPLFFAPKVRPGLVIPTIVSTPVVMGIDDQKSMPFVLDKAGVLHFYELTTSATGALTVSANHVALALKGATVASAIWQAQSQRLIIGSSSGELIKVDLGFETVYRPESPPRIIAKPVVAERYTLGSASLSGLAYHETVGRSLGAVILGSGTSARVVAVTFRIKNRLGGGGVKVLDAVHDLTALVGAVPIAVHIDGGADLVVVTTASGEVCVLASSDEGFGLRQRFTPFADLPDQHIARSDMLLGNVSMVVSHPTGVIRKYSLYSRAASGKNEQEPRRLWPIGDFTALSGTPTAFHAAARNKTFVIAEGDTLSLRHGTSLDTRWQERLGFSIADAIITPGYNGLMVRDQEARLHLYRLDDPHPEASWNALFGKVWYEGHQEPTHEWQSTGGDESEPKFSLTVLIFGTFKATLYAMIIAIPIALMAAIYTAEFMHPRWKRVVKPTMEIMASLPSVVLGFMAALWLAPRIENMVPSLIMIALALPAAAIAIGLGWRLLPGRMRQLAPSGSEFLVVIPIALLTGWLAWQCGPLLEQLVFAGDFRQWWSSSTGLAYQQRNALVAGIIMGFAVIPIIFTISEDALSNVPKALRSGSLAMGASRWQTAVRVVVPTASAGIFSALMIGLGRAVGETMIVVMASGNTGVTDFNIFNGLRSLSANIATEIGEAPEYGTLYRILFLSATLLFVMTFVLNTAAEVLRQHLRNKYKTV